MAKRKIQKQPQTIVQVVHVKAPFRHTPHLVLDVLSCGAWIPIHLIVWAFS